VNIRTKTHFVQPKKFFSLNQMSKVLEITLLKIPKCLGKWLKICDYEADKKIIFLYGNMGGRNLETIFTLFLLMIVREILLFGRQNST
jgi:hypothetical protein